MTLLLLTVIFAMCLTISFLARQNFLLQKDLRNMKRQGDSLLISRDTYRDRFRDVSKQVDLLAFELADKDEEEEIDQFLHSTYGVCDDHPCTHKENHERASGEA